ncbi:MAG: ABC transporter permease [Tepidisphaeraceae bacterium]
MKPNDSSSVLTGVADVRPDRVNWREELGLLLVYLLLLAVLSWLAWPYFLKVRNLLNILVAVSTIGIISVAMTMVIVSGGIDLAIGSVVALTGVMIAQLSPHVPMPVAVAAALLAGGAVGALNGAFITFARINPLIATLGTLSIIRGIAFAFSGGLTQTSPNPSFHFLGRGFVLGIPFPAVVMVILFALTAWMMRWTVFGRNIYAIGGNAQASRLAGLPVTGLKMTVYVLSGLSAALGGVFLASQLGAAAPQAAQGLELSVIAAVILGGTSLSGGKGTIWGTLLGVLIMGTLNNGLTLLNVSSYYQDVARGTVLLLAVGLDQLRQNWGER